ncbi:hypothetical protein H4219_004385 [Mycoemilia scoparia]|uniref:Glycosyl transferase family 25 domain-containing protein n=1 Tax=Mycoemilia scoparia TaxID=417184 RepID=A0A9W7ZYF7_9FUNG|nr:hypothetical protein H4219_004385 [Mycoemilia scoparia]
MSSTTYHRKVPSAIKNLDEMRTYQFSRIKSPNKLYTDHIYTITVPERLEQRARTQSMFDLMGLDVEYVFGMYPENDPEYAALQKKGLVSHLSGREFEIWKSHLKVWENMLERGYETALILEDNIDFQTNVHSMIRKGQDIISGKLRDRRWDIIYVGHCADEFLSSPADDDYFFSNLRLLRSPACGHAYILSVRGASKLSNLFRNYINNPIDLEIRDYIKSGAISGYSYYPSVFTQRRDFDELSFFKSEFFTKALNSTLEHVTQYKGLYSINEIVDMGLGSNPQ